MPWVEVTNAAEHAARCRMAPTETHWNHLVRHVSGPRWRNPGPGWLLHGNV